MDVNLQIFFAVDGSGGPGQHVIDILCVLDRLFIGLSENKVNKITFDSDIYKP